MSVYRTNDSGVREVAILYSPRYGAGWYTWNRDFPTCLTEERIVNLVLAGASEDDIAKVAAELWGEGFYSGGADGLTVKWLPFDEMYRIDEYDGAESVVIGSQEKWLVAQ